MLVKSAMSMAIGVTWLVAAFFLWGGAWNVRRNKRLRQIGYGFSITACFLGGAFLLASHALLYTGSSLALLCSILLLIETALLNK